MEFQASANDIRGSKSPVKFLRSQKHSVPAVTICYEWNSLRSKHHNLNVLVVGQTPPPYGGQAVMIQILLDGAYPGIDLHHVELQSSRDLGAIGKWQFVKIWRLMQVVVKIYAAKIRFRSDAIYYPPCGPGLLPVVRDIAVLCTTRFLFRWTIFHFHASGLTEYSKQLHPVIKKMFHVAYGRPDVAIRLSERAPSEGQNLGCRKEFIIANGIRDAAEGPIKRLSDPQSPVRVLFVALLTPDKGVLVVIEAVNALLRKGIDVELICVGGWESSAVRDRAEALIDPAFRRRFIFTGVLSGKKKWDRYRVADIFCFPSFFHSETFPLVLLEAMSFSLPILSTRWRGIPDVVREGINAILVEPMDIDSCVCGLATLIDDPLLRARMGCESRRRFLERFTIEKHREAMHGAFLHLKGHQVPQ